MEKTQIEKDYYVFQTNSYLKGTEDLISMCIIAQKYISTGDFIQGRAHLESITKTANYLKKRIEEKI